jgi:hypothetical protein
MFRKSARFQNVTTENLTVGKINGASPTAGASGGLEFFTAEIEEITVTNQGEEEMTLMTPVVAQVYRSAGNFADVNFSIFLVPQIGDQWYQIHITAAEASSKLTNGAAYNAEAVLGVATALQVTNGASGSGIVAIYALGANDIGANDIVIRVKMEGTVTDAPVLVTAKFLINLQI